MKVNLDDSYQLICRKVEEFENNLSYYKGKSYQEAEVRKDFIDPFFKALGWDIDHEHQKNPYKQEVKIEKSQKEEGRVGKRFADYANHHLAQGGFLSCRTKQGLRIYLQQL